MNVKIKIIILVGIFMTADSINSIIPFFQNVSAFSLTGTLDKLLGGLFHKPSSTQNNTTQPTQTQQNNNNNPTITNQPQTSPKLSGTTIPSKCNIINGDLPDPQCTPGSINTSVTQDNIKNTICVSGFTKTIRPPVSLYVSIENKPHAFLWIYRFSFKL